MRRKDTWTKEYCVDCGKLLSYQGAIKGIRRCVNHSHKHRALTKPWTISSGFKNGKENPAYTGNIPRNSAHICSPRYNRWREKVFIRDSFTCQDCKQIGGDLNAHHIKSWTLFPKLRYLLSNGVTLCKKCHNLKHVKKI